MSNWSKSDLKFMRRAISLAREKMGKTAPNPPVGCVIVNSKTDEILGEGATGNSGRPHAEEYVLDKFAGAIACADVKDLATYVTLEPCRSRSTGADSCSTKLIASSIPRIIVAQADPHPLAKGGCDALKEAGIDVEIGCCEEEAKILTRGFFYLVETGQPELVLSESGEGCDAEFTLLDSSESPQDALKRLGSAGLTRVFLKEGSMLAKLCLKQKLVVEN